MILDFSDGSGGKESTCNVEDLGLIPGLGRSPVEGNGNPLQYSCLENPMDRGAQRLQSMGSQKVRHNWVTNTFTLNRNDSWQAGSRSFSRMADLYLMVWHSSIRPSISKSLSPHDVPCFATAEGERIMKTMLVPTCFHQGGKYVAYLCISITWPWLIRVRSFCVAKERRSRNMNEYQHHLAL